MSAWKWSAFAFSTAALLSGCHRVEFDLSPQHFSECQGTRVAVHVRWSVPATTPKPISIYVNGVGLPETLWTGGGTSGQADTGKWMFDGSSLSLRDGNGALLARRTMTTEPCSQRSQGTATPD